MQSSDLMEFLSLVIDPIEGQLLVDAYDTLSAIGCNEHEFAIEQLLMTVDTDEYSNTIAGIREALTETLHFKLIEHGVNFTTQSIPHMTQCLIGLVSIDDYADPYTLWNIAIGEGTAEEALCEMLEFFTPYRWVDFIDLIGSVSTDLIIKIRELTAANLAAMEQLQSLEPPANVSISAIRDRLLGYSSMNKDFCIFRSISDGMPLGLAAISYIQANHAFLMSLNAEDLSKELFRIYLASDIADTQLIDSLTEDLSAITTNLNVVTGTFSRIKQLFKEYHDEAL